MIGINDLEFDRKERLFNRDVDRKERFAQTYTVMYGLLIACSQKVNAPNDVINYALPFLFFIIVYQILLSSLNYSSFVAGRHIKFTLTVYMINIFAFFSSATFSDSFNSFLYSIGGTDKAND